jgi:hypothetical protein
LDSIALSIVLEFVFSEKSSQKLASRSSPPIELPNQSEAQLEILVPRGILEIIFLSISSVKAPLDDVVIVPLFNVSALIPFVKSLS